MDPKVSWLIENFVKIYKILEVTIFKNLKFLNSQYMKLLWNSLSSLKEDGPLIQDGSLGTIIRGTYSQEKTLAFYQRTGK